MSVWKHSTNVYERLKLLMVLTLTVHPESFSQTFIFIHCFSRKADRRSDSTVTTIAPASRPSLADPISLKAPVVVPLGLHSDTLSSLLILPLYMFLLRCFAQSIVK